MLATFEIMTPAEFRNHLRSVAMGRFGPADGFPFDARVDDAVYQVWETAKLHNKVALKEAMAEAERVYAEFYANPPAPFVRRAGS